MTPEQEYAHIRFHHRKWETIQNEIDKCVVRYANNHRRKGAAQFGYCKWKKAQADNQNSLPSGI